MLIDVNKWIDKNGSFDEAGGLDLVRHGYEWIRRMRKFENKADRHTFQKVFGNKRGKDKLEYFDVEIDDKGKIYCKETYYRTREDVYKFNDLTVVDRNGDIRLVESSKSRLMLSNDQLDVVERMKGIIDDMVRLKMIMYIDQDYNLCFLPGDKIEDLAMDETDGFVDTTGIVTSIKSKDVVEFYVENPFVKIKDE